MKLTFNIMKIAIPILWLMNVPVMADTLDSLRGNVFMDDASTTYHCHVYVIPKSNRTYELVEDSTPIIAPYSIIGPGTIAYDTTGWNRTLEYRIVEPDSIILPSPGLILNKGVRITNPRPLIAGKMTTSGHGIIVPDYIALRNKGRLVEVWELCDICADSAGSDCRCLKRYRLTDCRTVMMTEGLHGGEPIKIEYITVCDSTLLEGE